LRPRQSERAQRKPRFGFRVDGSLGDRSVSRTCRMSTTDQLPPRTTRWASRHPGWSEGHYGLEVHVPDVAGHVVKPYGRPAIGDIATATGIVEIFNGLTLTVGRVPATYGRRPQKGAGAGKVVTAQSGRPASPVRPPLLVLTMRRSHLAALSSTDFHFVYVSRRWSPSGNPGSGSSWHVPRLDGLS
jgi:hypothetical protein